MIKEEVLLFFCAYPFIGYNPILGYICRIDDNKNFVRKLLPNEQETINVFVQEKQRFTNRKPINLAWEMLNSKLIPEGFMVYPKDTDEANIKANNLGLMLKSEYSKYKDAIDNIINNKLSLKCSSSCYKVRFKYEGRTQTKKFSDFISANRFKKDIYLKSVKLISKYYINK